ncbi:MAG: helix-turn-helix domain-containing protein [Spirochaetaceae bacterium]|jgi:transcriptional regulator with XRE-family HTH domain|nr:helix-turn-helix domain-containing protein [Spirochaetaceae bacterium]
MEAKEALQLRKLLAANIKERRAKLSISQEKLAELADVSVQTVNFIEGCRTWVSDKTLVKLACALRVDAYRLLSPPSAGGPKQLTDAPSLRELQQLIKYDIDRRFAGITPPPPRRFGVTGSVVRIRRERCVLQNLSGHLM